MDGLESNEESKNCMNMRISNRYRFLCIFILCLFCFAAAGQKKITILYTNDTHSRIEPFGKNQPDSSLVDKAGFVRRATFIAQERRDDKHLLLFDSGDFSQGSPYYTFFKGDVEVLLMNEMRYDAVAIGNHEFDYGLDNMARLFRLARFPIVCANYCVDGTVLQSLVKPYIILKCKGLKIGVFGLSPRLIGLVQNKNCSGIYYMDPVECANQVADELKNKKKCDLVICLSHLGWKGQMSDEYLIPHSHHIDIVLGGHSHSYFEKPLYYNDADGNKVLLTQMGKNGQYVGKMVVEMKRNKDKKKK